MTISLEGAAMDSTGSEIVADTVDANTVFGSIG
jgi:hypothetical protein